MSTSAPWPSKKRLQLAVVAGDQESVVRCSGRLTIQDTAWLKSEVKPLLARSARVMLDLTDLDSMDSSGLGAVISLYVSAKAAGHEFCLINLNQRVRELLGLTHLLSALTACGEYMIKTP